MPSEMVTNGRYSCISVKINGKPSTVQDQASARKVLLANCQSWCEKKNPNLLEILCGDQLLNLTIQRLLIQSKWKTVTFAEECDTILCEVAGCFESRRLEPRGRAGFRSHVD